ncbi:MAG: NnrU family protein, partial [Candidatus Obscuribacterales bacterium]|nr:NnrU family protein [Steroidobacteraceae bacterium]
LIAAYLPGRIKAVMKHPMLNATKFWALAHLLANGALADMLLFGGFLAWAVADRISVKRRAARPTPSLPASKLNDVIAVVLGLVIYVAFIKWLHVRWIGVVPFP